MRIRWRKSIKETHGKGGVLPLETFEEANFQKRPVLEGDEKKRKTGGKKGKGILPDVRFDSYTSDRNVLLYLLVH